MLFSSPEAGAIFIRGEHALAARTLVCALLSCVFSIDCAVAQTCSHPNEPAWYDSQHYMVRGVEATSPFDFLIFLKRQMRAESQNLPLKAGAAFSAAGYSRGIDVLREDFAFTQSRSPFKLRVITGQFTCDEGQKKLNVKYRVFLTDPIAYFASTSRFLRDSTQAPYRTTTSVTRGWDFKPDVGMTYNASRSASGYVGATLNPGSSRSLELAASAIESTSAHTESAKLHKIWTYPQHTISQAVLAAGFDRYLVPAGSGRVEYERGFAQIRAAGQTKPMNIGLHLGLAVQGGSSESGACPCPSGFVHSASLVSVKSYVGIERDWPALNLSASYANEAGVGTSGGLAFIKQIGHASTNGQIALGKARPGEAFHRNIQWELELGGGILTHISSAPVAARFFGGNRVQSFIPDDPWLIRDGAYIRSVPENKLAGTWLNGAAMGGTSFGAGGLTVAVPVWGRALVPPSFSSDPDFARSIDSAQTTAESTLALLNQTRDPHFQAILGKVETIRTLLDQTNTFVANLESTPATSVAIIDTLDKVKTASRAATSLGGKSPMEGLVLFDGPVARLPRLLKSLGKLSARLPDPMKQQAEHLAEAISRVQNDMSDAYKLVDVNDAMNKARSDMTSVRRIITTMTDQMNLASVAPVVTLDLARLSPGYAPLHYGPGGGIRFSLVTLDVTAVYAVNVNRAPGEGKGAFLFNLGIVNAFR
jgi:hypothetical protein